MYQFDIFNWGDNPNVVGSCFVVVFDNHMQQIVEPSIYLSEPKQLAQYECLIKFDNVFAARRWLEQYMPRTEICVVKAEEVAS